MRAALGSFDRALFFALYAEHAPRWVLLAIAFVSFLGSGWMLFALLPALALRAHRAWASWLLGALLATAALVAGAKGILGRVRPCHALPSVQALMERAPTDCSLPSGHAAGTFAFALFVCTVFGSRAGGAALALAVLVAASRVALEVHFPSDVLVGAMVGGLMGAAAGMGARAANSWSIGRSSSSR